MRAALLAWYDAEHRTLPWRSEATPWRVWVSEIMLQQTRVESVIGYFNRFVARFPTPASLAEAELDEVLGLWAGLGYYARARNLHKAAGQVVTEHAGEVPSTPAAFRALSGVGRYTCGAVQSIAFGHAIGVLDGNVQRVLCRLGAVETDPREPKTREALWARADALAAGPRPGDLNQALMELGARICTPRKPDCEACPLRPDCQAQRRGLAETLPHKAPRKARPVVLRVAGLARAGAGIWLGRRPEAGLLGGLWELPALEAEAGPALASLGLCAGEVVAQIKHVFTHREWRTTVHNATGTPRGGDYTVLRVVPVGEMDDHGRTGPSQKAVRTAGVKLRHRRGAGRG